MPSDARRILAAALFATLAGTGCTRLEYAAGGIPWLAYMRDAPFFDPYEAPRPAPAGTVAFDAPVGVVLTPIPATEAGLNEFAAGRNGTNPFAADSAFDALGQQMYERHCAVCHGSAGLGDGPIVQTDPAEQKYPPLAPNLVLPQTVARSDGYLYGLVWVGRGLMPAYGGRTTHRERWAIVNYVRRLQAATSAGGN